MGRLWDLVHNYTDNLDFKVSERQLAAKLGYASSSTFQGWREPKSLPSAQGLARFAFLARLPYQRVLDAALEDVGYLPQPRLTDEPLGPRKGGRDSLPYVAQRVAQAAALVEHDVGRGLVPETGDPEDVEDFLAAMSDDAFATARARRNKDPGTGHPLDVHDEAAVQRWLAAGPDGLDVNDPDDVRERLEEIALATGQRSPVDEAAKNGGAGTARRSDYDLAARETGSVSAGQARRRLADQAGEPETDNPDDVEPR